jgi:hypothetical protein
MLQPLTEAERDYAYSEGLLQAWLDKTPEPARKQLLEHLQIMAGAISAYREKYIGIQADYERLQTLYNNLMAASAQYLQVMQQQKEQIDQQLIEQQREFHTRPQTGLVDV